MLHIVNGLRILWPITSINRPSQISESLHRFLNLLLMFVWTVPLSTVHLKNTVFFIWHICRLKYFNLEWPTRVHNGLFTRNQQDTKSYSSGSESHHRHHLTHPLGRILWVHLKNVYQRVRCSNYLRVHRRLKPDNFSLKSSLKMCNHLAEHVLNTDILFLVKENRQSHADGICLNAVIFLLEVTPK